MMDLLQISAGLVIGSVMVAAFFMALSGLFQGRIARTHAVADSSAGRAFIVGLINLVFFAAVAAALLALAQWTNVQLFAFPALLVAAVLTVSAIFGLAGVAELLGARLLPQMAAAPRTGLGALLLAWACAVPYAGWFGLLPYTLALGLGALILSFLTPAGRAPAAP